MEEPLIFAPCWLLTCQLFNPEDGGSTFLRDVDELQPDYTALHPRRQCSSLHLSSTHLSLPGLKQPERDSYHFTSKIDVNNMWKHASILTHILMVWCLIKLGDNITLIMNDYILLI
jgi:hypothetical protein